MNNREKLTTKYPILDDWEFTVLKYEAWAIGNPYVLFPFARSLAGKWYVDIYIYRKADKCFERIIIRPHERIKKSEMFKLWEGNLKTGFSVRENDYFLSEISILAPELNMKSYEDIRDALRHVYYASHKENLCEQLYKCQLDIIAKHYDQVEDLNTNSTNIEDAFDLPLSLIRKMNSHFGLYAGLIDKSSREIAARIYRKYNGMLNDIEQIAYFQWKYLQDCLWNRTSPDKDMLKRLSNLEIYYVTDELDGEDIYDVYVSYKENRRIVKEMYNISFPRKMTCLDRPDELYTICYLARDFAERGDIIDLRIWDIYRETSDKYSYEDNRLFLRPPLSAKELMDEWKNQNNCLYSYILPMFEGETTILLLRRKIAPSESYITVEVSNGKLEQAYRRNNEDIGRRDREFLRSFCKKQGLVFNI